MGNITSKQRAPYVERFMLALILPRYLLIAHGVLIGGFSIAILGMLGLMHNVSSPLNPFAAYADIMPGQPSSAINAHGFSCQGQDYNYSRDPAEMHCILSPNTSVFSRIEVIYSNDLIQEISFTLGDTRLNIGDLILFLGITEIHPSINVLFLWRGNLGFALVENPSERFTMFSHVRQITLTNTRLSKP